MIPLNVTIKQSGVVGNRQQCEDAFLFAVLFSIIYSFFIQIFGELYRILSFTI